MWKAFYVWSDFGPVNEKDSSNSEETNEKWHHQSSLGLLLCVVSFWLLCVCVCVCVCTQCWSSLWTRDNPFWRRLVHLLNIIYLYSCSKADCVCLGWSSLWTDLWLVPALMFLNEMFSRSVLQNGVGGSSPVTTMLHVKARGMCASMCSSWLLVGKLPLSCKLWEADLYPVTHSPNEDAGGVYLITLSFC